MNINEKIFPETLFQLMLDVLGKTSRFTYIDGTQPFLMSFDGQEYYVYVKNLTSAYFKDRPDTTRAQLPTKDGFDKIKNSPIPFIFLGYDQDNDVLVCWNYHVAKERLNEKKSVSFYSRQFFQDEVSSGELMRKTLKNGDEPILFKRKDLVAFFSQIESFFPKQKVLQIANSLFDDEFNQKFDSVIEPPVPLNTTGGKIMKIIETDLIKQLKPIIETNHTFEAMKVAERYYNGQHSAMKPKDWLALIKGIDFNAPESTQNITPSSIAAEPLNKYSQPKSNQDDFVEFCNQAFSKQSGQSNNIHETPKTNELLFIEFLLNKGLSENSAKYYANAMGGKVADCIRDNVDSYLRNIYSIRDYNTVFDWSLSLYRTSQFKELDNKGNRQYSCALKHYLEFLYSTDNVQPFENEDTSVIPESRKRKSVILRVTYPDGHIVEERIVSNTLIDVVISAGAERVQSLGIMLNGENLVSNTILPRYATSQKLVGNNLYVMTCCDTNKKQRIIEQISEALNMNLKVETISII